MLSTLLVRLFRSSGWDKERDAFITNINKAVQQQSYDGLYAQLSALQRSLLTSAYSEEGHEWRLPAFKRLLNVKDMFQPNLTTFVIIVQSLYGCMRLDSVK